MFAAWYWSNAQQVIIDIIMINCWAWALPSVNNSIFIQVINHTTLNSTTPNRNQNQPHQTEIKINYTIQNQIQPHQTNLSHTKPNSTTQNKTHPYQTNINHNKKNSSIPNWTQSHQTKLLQTKPNYTKPNQARQFPSKYDQPKLNDSVTFVAPGIAERISAI